MNNVKTKETKVKPETNPETPESLRLKLLKQGLGEQAIEGILEARFSEA